MRMRFTHSVLASSLSLLMGGSMALANNDRATEVKKRLSEAHHSLRNILTAGDKGIPRDLLDSAECAIVVPGLKKGGFVVAAQYGKGFMTCRTGENRSWSAPANIRIEGGSVGLQAGAGEVDMFLLVMNKSAIDKLLTSEFKIGGEAQVMAGPVGRSSRADTDAFMHAKMLAWSHSRGVFAGLALEGSTLREDTDDNEALYGRRLDNKQIIRGNVAIPDAAEPMLNLLRNPATAPASSAQK